MKKIIIVAIILIAGYLIFGYSSKPEDVNLASVVEVNSDVNNVNAVLEDNYQYTFTDFEYDFTGYGPAGKFHEGFTEFSFEDNLITFDMTSVKTDTEAVDTHLCTDDFFNCEEYPTSTFVLESINEAIDDVVLVKGVFNYRDIEKGVSFEAVEYETGKYSGEFLLDTSEFGFKVPIVESEVLIKFDFSVLKEMIEEDVSTSTDQEILEE